MKVPIAAAVDRNNTEKVVAITPTTTAPNQVSPQVARVSSHSGAARTLVRSTPPGPKRKPVNTGAVHPRQPKAKPAIAHDSSAAAATSKVAKPAMTTYFDASTRQRATGRVSNILMVPALVSEE